MTSFTLLLCLGPANDDFIHAHNIHEFKDCTIVDGMIKILKTTFDGWVRVLSTSTQYEYRNARTYRASTLNSSTHITSTQSKSAHSKSTLSESISHSTCTHSTSTYSISMMIQLEYKI